MTINKYILYDERGEISDALAARASRLIDLQGFYTDSNMADLWARQADITDQINLVEGIKSIASMTDPRTFAQIAADEDAADAQRDTNELRMSGFTL